MDFHNYQMDGLVKATVTKNRPGQDVGLGLRESKRRIRVTDVSGLFTANGVPVEAGDQLLEVNGIAVTDKNEFPNGLKDVELFLKKEWSIWVKVKKKREKGKGSCYDLDVTAATAATSNSDSDDDSDSEHSCIEDSDEERDMMRKGRGKQRRRGRKPRSHSPFAAFTREDKRRGKKKSGTQQKAFDENDSASANTHTTASMSSADDDQTPPRAESRTCQSGALVDIDENDAVIVSPLTPQRTTKPKTDVQIKTIKGSSSGVTIELNDGKKISVTPEQLLEVVTATENTKDTIGAPMVYTPKQRSKSKLKHTRRENQPKRPKSKRKDKETTKENQPQRPRSKRKDKTKKAEKAVVDTPPSLPELSSTRNLLKDTSVKVSLSRILLEHTNKGPKLAPSSFTSKGSSSTRSLLAKLRKAPRRSSMPMNFNGHTSAPLPDILEGLDTVNSMSFKTKKKTRSKSPDSLPDEHSLRSTHSCMTNLIDPGDLMKIRGFTSRPKMNGATVEVVRKSKGTKGIRWDVRVISQKHIKESNLDIKRLISVSRENLNHFR